MTTLRFVIVSLILFVVNVSTYEIYDSYVSNLDFIKEGESNCAQISSTGRTQCNVILREMIAVRFNASVNDTHFEFATEWRQKSEYAYQVQEVGNMNTTSNELKKCEFAVENNEQQERIVTKCKYIETSLYPQHIHIKYVLVGSVQPSSDNRVTTQWFYNSNVLNRVSSYQAFVNFPYANVKPEDYAAEPAPQFVYDHAENGTSLVFFVDRNSTLNKHSVSIDSGKYPYGCEKVGAKIITLWTIIGLIVVLTVIAAIVQIVVLVVRRRKAQQYTSIL
ncbi:serine/threonine-protein kinase CBK1 [Acrasis kona]|uniref:Serine/threonine-protein kinase CBK1 n=1 Tax=Acrasis kona TaxID=1008807 RepID=A0AAW2ZSP1_9EUKA